MLALEDGPPPRADAVTFYLIRTRSGRRRPTGCLAFILHAHCEVIAARVGQRLKAINRFRLDLYHGGQDIVPTKWSTPDGTSIPRCWDSIRRAASSCISTRSTWCTWGAGRYVVVEDTARLLFGIGYQLKNLEIVGQVMPEFAAGYYLKRCEI